MSQVYCLYTSFCASDVGMKVPFFFLMLSLAPHAITCLQMDNSLMQQTNNCGLEDYTDYH